MDNDKTTDPCKRHDCKRVRAEMQAVVERVQAERDAALAECNEQARLNGMGAEREARLMAQVAELQAERDALAKDAARYQWLRDSYDPSVHDDDGGSFMRAAGDELDAAIDAAMSEGER